MRISFLLSVCVAWASAFAATPLVFVHGIKGSVLVDDQGTVGWLTASQALGLSTPDLRLPMQWDGDTQAKDRWRPTEILAAVSLIPKVWSTKIYGPFLEAAVKSGRDFHPFAYDWRRDPQEAVTQLLEKLEVLREKTGGGASVIGHSLGGMVVLGAYRKKPELFSAIVLVGSPFRGGLGFLPDMHEGAANGLNRKILAPNVLATFPSMYSFLPAKSGRLVRAADGGLAEVDFFDAASWRAAALGGYKDKGPTPQDEDQAFGEALRQARRFRDSFSDGSAARVPVIVVRSEAVPTFAVARRGAKGWDFESEPKEPGDGRVLAAQALPPENLGTYELIPTNQVHEALLEDPKVQARIFSLP